MSIIDVYTAIRRINPRTTREVYQIVVGGKKVFSRELDPSLKDYERQFRELSRDSINALDKSPLSFRMNSIEGEIFLESSPAPTKLPEFRRASFFANLLNELDNAPIS